MRKGHRLPKVLLPIGEPLHTAKVGQIHGLFKADAPDAKKILQGSHRGADISRRDWRVIWQAMRKVEALHTLPKSYRMLPNLSLSHYPIQLKLISSSVQRNTSVEMANLLLFSAVL